MSITRVIGPILVLFGMVGNSICQAIPPLGGPIGSNTDPTNPANYSITYISDGKDTLTSYVYENGQVVEKTTTYIWLTSYDRPESAVNFTNQVKTVSVKSEGVVKIHVSWIGDPTSTPNTVNLKIQSPTSYYLYGSTFSGSASGSLNNGIGSPAIDDHDSGKITPQLKLRTVPLVNGVGELEIHKKAEVGLTGMNVQVAANAEGMQAVVDTRKVSIDGINGGWPTTWRETQLRPVSRFTSEGIRHEFQYMGRVAESSDLQFGSSYTNFSNWDIGLPFIVQTIDTYQSGSVIYNPETLSPSSNMLNSSIDFGGSLINPLSAYTWSGHGRYNETFSGTLPLLGGIYLIPDQAMRITPDALIKQRWFYEGSITNEKENAYSLMRGDTAQYELTFSYPDGVTAESVRNVSFHSAAEPEEVGMYIDGNVNGEWIKPIMNNPVQGDTVGIPGWATMGEWEWPSLVKKPDDKILYQDEILSQVSARYIGIISEEVGEALGTLFSILSKHLTSFINAQYPPPVSFNLPRNAFDSLPNSYEIKPLNWLDFFQGGNSQPPSDLLGYFKEHIGQFYWKLMYRPTLRRFLYTLDHYDTLGFTSRDLGDRKVESDIRQSTYHYTFHLFPGGESID